MSELKIDKINSCSVANAPLGIPLEVKNSNGSAWIEFNYIDSIGFIAKLIDHNVSSVVDGNEIIEWLTPMSLNNSSDRIEIEFLLMKEGAI